ncbi:alpha-galactosidase [Chitinophaga silvatica]|uniref:Alpha-galactosidase n=1 Tax=Chitinophaga silvatica TaxID=2282649 RepID=A0A3E1YGQ7_9BACT|nr:alpha-galactosidase [Chitinophaga silvatica]RFS26548.1 alpha-galactosidase [Chitinophaga silvatica]
MKYLWIVCLFCCAFKPTKAQQQVIKIGKTGRIVYQLNNGKYDIWSDGKLLIKNVYVSYDGLIPDTGKVKRNFKQISAERYSITHTNNGFTYTQLFEVPVNGDGFYTRLIVEGEGAKTSRIIPFATNSLLLKGDPTVVQMPFDNDAWIKYKSTKLSQADLTSAEVTAVFDEQTKGGLVIGSVEHSVWKTGIKISGSRDLSVIAGFTDSIITRDKKEHGIVTERGKRYSSPLLYILPVKDWQRGLEKYADANISTEGRFIEKWQKAKPVGWNSWGSIQTKLSLAKAKGVVDFFADSCKGFRAADGTMFIDLDSYWDNLAPGGMNGDFSQLTEFSNYCKAKGLKPGIYWAPFVDWGKYPRKVEGGANNYEEVWTKVNGQYCDMDGGRAMDPTHPATKARIAFLIGKFKAAGFEMIKIDFLGHAAIEGDTFFDKDVKTGMQAYKEGMEWLVKQLDNKMLVYAAISPNLATARYAHMRRIACDAFSNITESAYTLNGTTYGWWLNRMYDYLDADHVVLKGVGPNMNRARIVSALVTGTLVLGDDFTDFDKKDVLPLLQNKELLKLADGQNWVPVDQEANMEAANVFYKPGAVALVNYGNEPLAIDLKKYLPVKVKKIKEVFSGNEILWEANKQINIPAADAVILTW